jgi:hypothetical protein
MPTVETKHALAHDLSGFSTSTFSEDLRITGNITRAANDNFAPYRLAPKLDQWWWPWLVLAFSLPVSFTAASARVALETGGWLRAGPPATKLRA